VVDVDIYIYYLWIFMGFKKINMEVSSHQTILVSKRRLEDHDLRNPHLSPHLSKNIHGQSWLVDVDNPTPKDYFG
jgi:hypothetical protein